MEEYIESIQILFEENGLETPSKEVCESVVECIRAVDEMFSYGTPSPIDFQNAETERLKQRIEELENERDKAIWNFTKKSSSTALKRMPG